jgi:hypothetical protein
MLRYRGARSPFYRHYSSKDDIVIQRIDTFVDELLIKLKECGHEAGPKRRTNPCEIQAMSFHTATTQQIYSNRPPWRRFALSQQTVIYRNGKVQLTHKFPHYQLAKFLSFFSKLQKTPNFLLS